jgi:uncharacterized protein YkwD
MSSTIRESLLNLHNRHRALHGARSLTLNSVLNQGATRVAELFGKANYWPCDTCNHRRPGGQTFAQWWNSYYKGTFAYYASVATENLGRGWTTSTGVFGPMNAHGGGGNTWTQSTSHHNYLIDPRLRKVGFGIYDSTRIGRIWVAHFTS